MSLVKVNEISNNATEDNLLNIGELVEGISYEKIALCTNAEASLTKTNAGFARFTLKDCNANVVIARLFDIKDFQSSGLALSVMRNKPVILKFTVQQFNGQLSLIIDGEYGIKLYDGDFDRSRFIGKYKYNAEWIESIANWCHETEDWKLPVYYRTASFIDLCQGRVGAFAKLMELSLSAITRYTDLDGIDGKKLLQVYFAVMEIYFSVFQAKDTYGFLEEIKSFDVLMGINDLNIDKDLRAMVLNCAKPLVGFGQPTHLYSHLINSAIKNAEANLQLVLTNNTLITGASAKVGGVLLSKY